MLVNFIMIERFFLLIFLFKVYETKFEDDLFWKQRAYLSTETTWFLLDTISGCIIIKNNYPLFSSNIQSRHINARLMDMRLLEYRRIWFFRFSLSKLTECLYILECNNNFFIELIPEQLSYSILIWIGVIVYMFQNIETKNPL